MERSYIRFPFTDDKLPFSGFLTGDTSWQLKQGCREAGVGGEKPVQSTRAWRSGAGPGCWVRPMACRRRGAACCPQPATRPSTAKGSWGKDQWVSRQAASLAPLSLAPSAPSITHPPFFPLGSYPGPHWLYPTVWVALAPLCQRGKGRGWGAALLPSALCAPWVRTALQLGSTGQGNSCSRVPHTVVAALDAGHWRRARKVFPNLFITTFAILLSYWFSKACALTTS